MHGQENIKLAHSRSNVTAVVKQNDDTVPWFGLLQSGKCYEKQN